MLGNEVEDSSGTTIQFAVLWGMSDVSPGRICKFNSAAGANVQSCGDYLAPHPPLPALGKFANSIQPFSTTTCMLNLMVIFDQIGDSLIGKNPYCSG